VVTPDSRIKFLRPGSAIFEDEYGELLDVAAKYVGFGDVVWDIGSNVGIFTFAAAEQAGHKGAVLSVEPDITLVQLLRKSAQRRKNADLNVEILSAAVSEKCGVSAFHIAEQGRTANALETERRAVQNQSARRRQLVPTVTLDQLLEISSPPDVLKVDVEGAEDLVLEGGTRVLNDVRPILYCEVGKGKQGSVTDLLKQAEYAIFDPREPLDNCHERDQCVFNTLALPRERIGQGERLC
jgi:FkbM family methyltransferase